MVYPRYQNSLTPEQRFWSQVTKSDGCWLWSNICTTRYGRFHLTPTHRVYAHRFSYELAYGPIPRGLFVLHRCDTPACVRPDHLFLGTDKDNAEDRESKGRGGPRGRARGERQWNHTLTTEQVIQMRERYHAGISPSILAKDYGIAKASIYRIINRQSWSHVP